ncbi:MAG: hypothetical protein HY202_01820 [Nitrospirae bacterium]|nr:hypothetical protein [Nitrospirota bacterium]MBI3604745.1 hypothetical protein [Nitrospirota bacterium]
MADLTRDSIKGYRYHLTEEAILKYRKWSIQDRLIWLEEANRFLLIALSDHKKKIREELRKGIL